MTFNPLKNLVEGSSLTLPCGGCIGCRMDRSAAWAVRCMHEAQMHDQNCCVTLTYDDKHLPDDYGVHVRDLQLFFKRLRFELKSKKIRYFACGEYGDQLGRPHYHALLFGHQFDDLKRYKQNVEQPQRNQYTSEKLAEIWGQGFATVGYVTTESAGYVARYAMKKITGDKAVEHYTRLHPISGKWNQVSPEFLVQSRRPGIGAAWISKYHDDVFPSGFLVLDGRKIPVPRFYDTKLKEDETKKLKRQRKAKALKKRQDNTPERLAVREQVLDEKIKRLTRNL